MKALQKALNIFENLVEWVGAYMMAVMVAIVAYQVFGRYVLHKTPAWTEEVALLFMMAYGFLSIATGIGRGAHLRINIIYERLPHRVQLVLDWMADILNILFGLFLIIEGYKFTVLTWSSQLPVTGLPNGLQYVVIPITGLVIVIYGLYLFIPSKERNMS